MNALTDRNATPGPWEVGSTGMGYSIRGDANGHCVAFTNTASCSKAALRNGVTKDDEELANACLAAAAPELLKACCALLALCGGQGINDSAMDKARAAIEKATGSANSQRGAKP